MSDSVYGDDFDPEAQFDEIDPTDFAWHRRDDILLVRDTETERYSDDGVFYRDVPDWDVYCDPSRRVVDVNLRFAVNDPIGIRRKYGRRDNGKLDPRQRAAVWLAYALTEVVERDEPSF